MARYDESSAQCQVFTFKEGLLSKVAHDLKIRVSRFFVEVDEGESELRAEFRAASLRVVHAMKDGRPSPAALSAGDRRKIEQSVAAEVLHPQRYATVLFESHSVERSDRMARISGQLDLHGTRRPLVVEARRQGDQWVAEVTLHQPDWGITPYRAMLGALRLKADVRVRLTIPHRHVRAKA